MRTCNPLQPEKTLIPLVAAVSIGGVAGVVALCDRKLDQRQLAAALLYRDVAVNIVGCLLIGILYGLFLIRPEVPIEVRAGTPGGFPGWFDHLFILFTGYGTS